MQWLAEDKRTNSVEEIVYFNNFDLQGARLCLKLHIFFFGIQIFRSTCAFLLRNCWIVINRCMVYFEK